MLKVDSLAKPIGDPVGKLVLVSNEGASLREGMIGRDERMPLDVGSRAMLPRAVVPIPPVQPRLGFVVVVDPLALRRDCISRVVQNWITPSQVIPVGAASDLEEVRASYGNSIKLVLMNIGSFSSGDHVVARNVAWLAANLPDVPIVVLGDDEDADGIVELMGMGIRGFVPSSIEPRVARCALELVEAGGSFAPTGALLERLEAIRLATRGGAAETRGAKAIAGEKGEHGALSERQHEVMQLIACGLPNKTIARRLGMCESTVKVHVRQILRKLGAKNRTQVALMSVKAANDAAS